MRTEKVSGEHRTHVRVRKSPYLKSSQERFVVPDFLVAWQVGRNKTDYTRENPLKVQKSNVHIVLIQ